LGIFYFLLWLTSFALDVDWVERGGIVGRAILLDYARWRENTHQAPAHPGTSHAITIEELESVAKFQGLEFRKGDILLLRTGFSKWYSKACDSEKERIMKAGNFIGVERSLCAAQWLWNNHFAAVACDAPGFECCPVPFGTQDEVVLHEWILVHFGMPLGEVWNLEKLSELCEELGRWTCFFTSAPLYLKGGVASPPNAIAVM
jgi:kynurenine formamidase